MRERETEQGYYKEPSRPHNMTDIYVSVDALFIQVQFFFSKEFAQGRPRIFHRKVR